jgi:hypothetical protein
MFTDGYYTYENFTDAATRSPEAVEAALRVRLDVGTRPSFVQLIDHTRNNGLINDHAHNIFHTGRICVTANPLHATTTSTTQRMQPASLRPLMPWSPTCSGTDSRPRSPAPGRGRRAAAQGGQDPEPGG